MHWTTVNEANVFALGGYDMGFVPPNRCSFPFGTRNCSKGNSSTEPYLAMHHCLLAHASAAALYNTNYKVIFLIFAWGIAFVFVVLESSFGSVVSNDLVLKFLNF